MSFINHLLSGISFYRRMDPVLASLFLLFQLTIVLSFISIAHGVNPMPVMEVTFPTVTALLAFAVGVTMARG